MLEITKANKLKSQGSFILVISGMFGMMVFHIEDKINDELHYMIKLHEYDRLCQKRKNLSVSLNSMVVFFSFHNFY